MLNNLILIFTRNPELGKVKTRLAKGIGDKNALEIYEVLLNHTNDVVRQIPVSKRVLYSNEIEQDDIWNNDLYQKRNQFGNDLGARMRNAFADAFEEDYQKVVIIGTDLYDLETSDILNAFDKLENHDVVIGPAEDGGYYLLGLKFLPKGIFINKLWGTSSVLSDTINDIEHLNFYLLKTKNDIDTLQDIEEIAEFQKYI